MTGRIRRMRQRVRQWWRRERHLPRVARELGQTTAEYALVIVGAASLAALLLVWASGSGAIGRLFDAVLGRVLDQFG